MRGGPQHEDGISGGACSTDEQASPAIVRDTLCWEDPSSELTEGGTEDEIQWGNERREPAQLERETGRED